MFDLSEHCPECGGQLIHQCGCIYCPHCGWCECNAYGSTQITSTKGKTLCSRK